MARSARVGAGVSPVKPTHGNDRDARANDCPPLPRESPGALRVAISPLPSADEVLLLRSRIKRIGDRFDKLTTGRPGDFQRRARRLRLER